MLSALLSFLGGTAFRMIWGEVSAFFTAKQEHKQEVERMRLQAELAAQQHAREMESIKVQADLGIKLVRVQAEADVSRLETEGWLEAVKAVGRPIGIRWVDAWNAVIRPGVATWSVVMLSVSEFGAFEISATTESVCFAALGIYLADRTLGKRGK